MRRAAPLVAALLLLALPASAAAAPTTTPGSTATRSTASPLTQPPKAGEISSARAERLAAAVPKIAAERRANPGSTLNARKKDGRWVVDVWTKGPKAKQIGQVYVSLDGRVTEAWTGFQVAWTMARGYPGAFGQSVNSPWIWVTLSVLFVLPFVDVRRPWRMLHLDLLVLVGFGASLAFFNAANLGLSVPLSAPLLAYLAVRLAWVGLRRGPAAPGDALRLLVPWQVLAVGALFLIGLRIGLNIVDGNVIDVGYSGVIGADKLAHGRELYGAFPSDNERGDTYGPLLYLAYVPFELIWPWTGRWDNLPAAHAAAGVFDAACILLLFLIGRRLRGTALGVVLVYAWVSYPFTIYATNSGVNDALPAALVLAAIWAHGRPAARGAFATAAG
ncbi:MAG: hypothetical protein MUC84_07090, partial [Solirubrobacteraceae bacterium]|nr:hypothetical protein [Solirubrobacteraceae bacterium]